MGFCHILKKKCNAMDNKKLKPIIYTSSYFKSGYNNTTQQMFLLKALKITQDPKKLKELIGVRTVAEVYQTLDKLAMRKEYHKALAKHGVSFDFIVEGIKGIATTGYKDSDRLKAYQALLKSVGMDDYKESGIAATGTWEEVLLKKIEEEKLAIGSSTDKTNIAEYEVIQPIVPESAKLSSEEEENITSSVYDSK